jgi:glycoprotein-mannosyl O6-kinase
MSIYPNWLGCKKGFFKLPKMDKCRPWLNCREIEKITVNRRINHGLGKEVFDATWNDLTVAYVRLRPERLHQEPIRGRVRAGIENLIRLQPSPYVTQVLGYCFEGLNSIMIAELAPYGDLKDFLTSIDYANLNPLGRLGVSIRLARVFSFMHNSPIGTRVNCDMTKVGS